LFREGAQIKLDSSYWQPQSNIALVHLLQGHLREAYVKPEEVRTKYADDPEAFANASLIMASAIESNIDRADQKKVKDKYSIIIKILEQALERRKEDNVVRKSLIDAYIFGKIGKKRVEECLKNGLNVPGFRAEISKGLQEDEELFSNFEDEYPELKRVVFPTD
jgi:hypothetical protein